MSQNRIRELTRESFSSLTDLKFLYLFDNMINMIEDDTFAKLTNIEALDLSGNGLLEVPPEIFNLPLLRNLYIADNSFGDRGFETLVKVPKPIRAPLKILSIANNRLYKMPDFGILPELYKLNISSNPMRDLIPQQFSPFCHMKEIDLNNTVMEKCRCEEVTRFLLKKREAYLLSSFYCDVISSGVYKRLCFINSHLTWATTLTFRMQNWLQRNFRWDERLSRVFVNAKGRYRTPDRPADLGHNRHWCRRLSRVFHRMPLLPAPPQRQTDEPKGEDQQHERESHQSTSLAGTSEQLSHRRASKR